MGDLRKGVLDAKHSASRFSTSLCVFVNEMNALHPFREGNGRVLREFIVTLAQAAGYGVASHVLEDGPRWLKASIAGFRGHEQELTDILSDMLVTVSTERRGNFFTLRPEERSRLCSKMKSSDYPDEIKREYLATLTR